MLNFRDRSDNCGRRDRDFMLLVVEWSSGRVVGWWGGRDGDYQLRDVPWDVLYL